MKRYEYKVLEYNRKKLLELKGEKNDLQELGYDGWKLATTTYDHYSGDFVLMLIREIEVE